MSTTLAQLAQSIGTSSLHDLLVAWLRTVPGLPPIVQTLHILSIAVVMGSIVMIDLKVLGLALPSQNTGEMMRRLLPWTWSALVLLAISGLVFVIARPRRYFVNPVFGIKVALLLPAIVLTAVLHRLHKRPTVPSALVKCIAALSLPLWLGVMLAGRWIAYADYLFPPD